MPVHSRPLILLTRPRAASQRFAAQLSAAATDPAPEIMIAPLQEITGTGAVVDISAIAGLILTSENAVPYLPPVDVPVYCVGPRTAQAAREAGFGVGPEVEFGAHHTAADADGLVQALIQARVAGPLLHAHGVHVAGAIADRLSRAGIPTRSVAVYDQTALAPPEALRHAITRPGLVVPLFSPRSAGLFADATAALRPDTRLIAFSPNVAAALPVAWQDQVQTLAHPDVAEMVARVLGMHPLPNSP